MRQFVTTLAELAGAVMIVVGAFQFAEPLGWVVAGVLSIVGSVLVADS